MADATELVSGTAAPHRGAVPAGAPVAGGVERAALTVTGLSKRYEPAKATIWTKIPFLGGREGGDDEDDLEQFDEEIDDHGELRPARWAIRDLDFSVPPGGGLGLIGPEGSGKSTVAKILGRVVFPTTGRAVATGRISVLTGKLTVFLQPTLSVRKNMIIAARLRGFSRREIARHMDEILEFAGLSGTERIGGLATRHQWNLIAATLIHLDAAVYVIDATLGLKEDSVAERCLTLLERRQLAGAAIVQTGGSVDDVRRLCDRIVCLDEGRAVAEGSPDEVETWLAAHPYRGHTVADADESAPSSDAVRLVGFLSLLKGADEAAASLDEARTRAVGSGHSRTRWTDVAAAAGLDLDEAGAIVDRLGREHGDVETPRPDWDSRVAIAGARVVSEGAPTEIVGGEEPVTVEVDVVFEQDDIEFFCAITLRSEAGRRISIRQPTSVVAGSAGGYRISAALPPGALDEGRWRLSIGVTTTQEGSRRRVVRRAALGLRVVADAAGFADGPTDGLEPVDVDELEETWNARSPTIAVEWHVHHDADG